MKKACFRLLPAFLFIFSCTTSVVDVPVEEQTELIDVLEITPVYESIQSIVSKTTVEPPVDYDQSGKIVTYKNYIFINSPYEGIHVVDNSNPANPINLSFINAKGSLDMAIIDDYLYVDMYSALVVFDISDVTNPVLMEDYTIDDAFYYNIYLDLPSIQVPEGLTYEYETYTSFDTTKGIIVDWEYNIVQQENNLRYLTEVAVDAETASAPQVSTDESFSNVSSAGSLTRFLPVGRFLYAINSNEIILFQVGENYQPTRWSKLETETTAETLFQFNNLLFVGSIDGMLMYDVETPENPEFLNRISHFRSCDPVVANESYAYVTLRGGTNCFTSSNELQIIDITNPKELQVISRYNLFNPHGLGLYENFLIICDGTAGIKVLSVENPEEPTVLETYPIEFAYDVIIDYPSAIVVGENDLYQYDISNLPKLTLISQIETN